MARDLKNIGGVIVKLGKIMKHSLLRTFICFSIILSSLLRGGSWQDGVPLNTPREGATSAAMGDYIYVFGGKTLNNTILNTVERFNLNTGIWEDTIASFNTPRMNAAAIVHDGKIFLTGGSNNQSSEAISKVEIYYPAQNSWQVAQDMRKEREAHALAFFNNHIYAIGGARDQSHLEDGIEWYDDTTGEWEEAPFQIISERAAFYSAVVRDTFYMFGGYYYGPVNTSYYKPPLTLDWISGPHMQTRMGYGASAQLGDSIYIIGGDAFSGITDTVEVFETRSKQISLGTFLPFPRKGTTAVSLNGKIYVIGGVTSQSGPPAAIVQVYSHGPTGISNSGDPNLIKNAQLVGYPNPFNSTIRFKFEIQRSSFTNLTIYDLQGKRIKQLVNEPLFQGTHFFRWDGEDLQNRQVASGIYFAILKGDSFYQTFKIFYVK